MSANFGLFPLALLSPEGLVGGRDKAASLSRFSDRARARPTQIDCPMGVLRGGTVSSEQKRILEQIHLQSRVFVAGARLALVVWQKSASRRHAANWL